MRDIDDELFDDKIKERIKNEINCVPDDINEKIDEAIKKIRKRRVNVKKICSICAICIVGTLLFGITMPTYASNIPIIGSILEKFNYKTYENYDKYASDLNITKESNGLKVTVNKVVYDEIELSVFYTVESQNKMQSEPMFSSQELKINGKKTTSTGGGTGKFIDDNKTFVGVTEYNVGKKKNTDSKDIQNKMFYNGDDEIPDKFVINLNITEILYTDYSTIKGNWNFDIPVTSEKVLGKGKEQNCDIDLSRIVDGYHINKVITTPLNTAIQGRYPFSGSHPGLSFVMIDDKGRNIPNKSNRASGGKDGNDVCYFNNQFKELYDNTESLTFIPYKYTCNANNKYMNVKLNLQAETKLYSDDGTEYATITRIETENEKTKIYYKSKYGVHVAPIEVINNKTGEKILAIDNSSDRRKQEEDIIYLNDSDEYVIVCDKELKGEDFSIKCLDVSKSIEVYNDDRFTIKVN
ncbi:DUF4179 domain-containing protein [Clostridium uliginosum]|uniref:DUF4179 domain-containing protein n=1 Tax=Clostridium uliginosum TaxID=119641 RepID=A0A1I1LVN4_9CLOT|nr:DUF4179 domain-containing protein [Clostridium uliginosum]SFC76976.1 protein of unknown function [Clostridium uliginosum]